MTHIPTRNRFFAHSVHGSQDTNAWEPLEFHLEDVAARCAKFATKFHSAEWGQAVGLLHDLGKYSHRFQDYLLTANGFEAHLEQHSKVDHSTAGAKVANESYPGMGRLLAYVIAGHHAGLANAFGSRSGLLERMKKPVEAFDHAPVKFLAPDVRLSRPPLNFPTGDNNPHLFQYAFFTRMLFSCLVDADFLATEKFMDPVRAESRAVDSPLLSDLRDALTRFLSTRFSSAAGMVNQQRQSVLNDCLQAAQLPPGFFSLTVPTGGGKTLSSLAFALEHAVRHGKSRIIYAIPFTSIVEQTATVFRNVFEDLESNSVLEHHSNLDPQQLASHEDAPHESVRSRLAAENWDAPLIVTTNVQLLESLFAAKTSRCRKLHNIVNSVIILDEAQTLPPDRLRPTLAALEELVRNYGCTIVLCTATQPAIHHSPQFPIGLKGVREIIQDPVSLSKDMRRVRVENLGPLSDEQLLNRLCQLESCLTIVNTKSHAAKLFRESASRGLDNESLFHLSTLMCGEHRASVLKAIRKRLQDKQPCHVVSTQLIEAGVDVDFPVVYRSLAGVDSIAQAAGRCNREGKLPTATVYVFEPTDVRLMNELAAAAQSTREVLPRHPDPLDLEAVHAYFDLHYWKNGKGDNCWDRTKDKGVMNRLDSLKCEFNFREASERYQLIEQEGTEVFVPYGEAGVRLLEELRNRGPNRLLMRKLQRYSVTLFEQQFRILRPAIEMYSDPEGRAEYAILTSPGSYDDKLGVRIDRQGYIPPELMVW